MNRRRSSSAIFVVTDPSLHSVAGRDVLLDILFVANNGKVWCTSTDMVGVLG